MAEIEEQTIVGYFGTRSLFRKNEKLGPVYNYVDIITGEPAFLEEAGIMLPRFGPFQVERKHHETTGPYVWIRNVSGYTVHLVGYVLPDGKEIGGNTRSDFHAVEEVLTSGYPDDAEKWRVYSRDFFGDMRAPDQCLLSGHDWVDTGMNVSYCRRCEVKGRYDFRLGGYKYEG